MPDIAQQIDSSIYADEEAPPSWQDLRDDGAVLIDTEDQKLAIYPGGMGAVVMASQERDDPVPRFIVLEQDSIPQLIAALTKAQAEAEVVSADLDAQYAVYADQEAREALVQKGGA